MDVNDDMPNDNHCPPMDLIALQHEIQQTMDSMKDFFFFCATNCWQHQLH